MSGKAGLNPRFDGAFLIRHTERDGKKVHRS